MSGTTLLSEAQVAQRRQGIGASDVPAILGVSPYRTPLDVWREKVQGKTFEGNEYTEWGNRLEEPIAQAYLARLRQALPEAVLAPVPLGTQMHPTKRWALATPDRLVMNHTELDGDASWLLEIKNKAESQRSKWGPDGTDRVPDEVDAQVRWQMYVTNYPRVDVAALFGGHELRVYTVTHDPTWEDANVPIVEAFWEAYVLTGIPPMEEVETPVQERDSYREEVEGPVLDAIGKLSKLDEVLAQLEAERKELRDQLGFLVGGDKGVTGPWGKVSFGWVNGRTDVDWKAVAMALKERVPSGLASDLIQTHTRTRAGYRALRYTLSDGILTES